MTKRNICVVTGSRAEYGLLYWVLKEIQESTWWHLQLAVTGTHLSPVHGYTCREIESDGFSIDSKVEMLLASDSPVGITKSTGLGLIGFGDAFHRLRPDMVLLLGDRFEILAAAQAALFARIPIAHIAGGDTTEGAFDEAIRHSVTKMSHVHFATNAEAARRLVQLGEDPQHVHNVGSPGIDAIKRATLKPRADLEKELEFRFQEKNVLVTFHPVTLDRTPSEVQFSELLHALQALGSNVGIVMTYPNADTEGAKLSQMLEEFTDSHGNVRAYRSLGQMNYLSMMAQVDAIAGNSSSGLYEAPSFKKPTVDIGDRQKGRLAADSVIHCPAERGSIESAIRRAFDMDCSNTTNPYGDGTSARRIVELLNQIDDPQSLLKKHFFNRDLRS